MIIAYASTILPITYPGEFSHPPLAPFPNCFLAIKYFHLVIHGLEIPIRISIPSESN